METRVLLTKSWGVIHRIQLRGLRKAPPLPGFNSNWGYERSAVSALAGYLKHIRHNSTNSTSTSATTSTTFKFSPEVKRDEVTSGLMVDDKPQEPEPVEQARTKSVVSSPDNSKLFKVAIIGLPNAGKSTLVNSLMSLGVCPVSKRVHTTRTNQKAVLLQDETQIVFVDTPGLVNMNEIKRFSFRKDFVFGPEKSIVMADIVAVIHDISSPVARNKLDPRICGVLEKFPEKNSILILNKVDAVQHKGVLLDTVRILSGGLVGGKPIKIKKSVAERQREEEKSFEMENLFSKAKRRLKIRSESGSSDPMEEKLKELSISSFSEDEIKEGLHLQGWRKFHDIFMISALNGDGIDLLKNYLLVNARPGPWMFNEDVLTDVDPQELAVRIIKSKLLDHLPQEIPYQLKPKIEYWEQKENGELRIIVLLKCPNERYLGRVVGTGAAVINRISSESESILVSLLRVPISLHIKVYADEKSKK